MRLYGTLIDGGQRHSGKIVVLSFDFAEEFAIAPSENLMLELVLMFLTPDLMEVVHVELD